MKARIILCLVFGLLGSSFACQTKHKDTQEDKKNSKLLIVTDSLERPQTPKPQVVKAINYAELPDSAMIELIDLDSSFVLDVRYATPNNFMKEAVYPCPKVLLRKKVAMALIQAHQAFQRKGYRIKVFDGYRPLSVQWKLWNKTTNKNYVANPKRGSNHNRGCAVDLTLVDSLGNQLDMGTVYDFFGKKAHHTYTKLPPEVLKNRQMLKNTLLKYGFTSIRSEWWHYNFKTKYKLSDKPLPCHDK